MIGQDQPGGSAGDRVRIAAVRLGLSVWAATKRLLTSATFWLVAGTWALAIVGYIGIQKTDTAATKQLAIMQADQRAWVGEKIEPNQIAFDQHGGSISFQFSLINGGRSVANYAMLSILAKPYSYAVGPRTDETTFDLGRRPACRPNKTNSAVGAVVLPGQKTDIVPARTFFTWQQIRAVEPNPSKAVGFSLIGCVDYVLTTTGDHRQTLFWYILAIPTNHGPRLPIPKPGTSYPYVLTKLPIGSSAN